MLEALKNALKSIFRNKLRSYLTVGGIFIGVLSVVVISSIGETGKTTVDNQLVNMGMDSIVITGDKSNETGLCDEDLQVVKQVSSVSNAMPVMYLMSDTEILSQINECMLWGINEDADNVIQLQAVYGRLINKGDILSKSRVCVIDEKIAVENYKRANIVGKKIQVRINNSYEEFEVVGIVKNGVNVLQNMLAGIIPNFVYIPYTTMDDLSSQSYYDQIVVKLKNGNEMTNISDDISHAITTNRAFPTELRVENLLKQRQQLNDILGIITIVLSAIAAISLVVSGLSIMTVMLVAVNERTREIGIKKSIGATNADIMFEFLIESILITVIGGLLGSLFGICVSYIGCGLFSLVATINYFQISQILLITIIIGLTFGVYPAYKASRLKPVDALRYE